MNNKGAKLYFLELAMSGVYHSAINAGFLSILKDTFPEVSEFIIKAEKQHLNACRTLLGKKSEGMKFRSFYFPKVKLASLIFRDLIGFMHAMYTFCFTRKSDILFFSYVLPVTHIGIILINKLLRRKIFICLHGQMEAFIPESPLRYTKLYFGLEKPFFKMNKYGYYVVLGEAIIKEISFLFSVSNRLIVIDHPYNYDNKDCEVLSFAPLRIGQIGVGDLGKGTELIFDLANMLQEFIKTKELELTIVGKLNPTMLRYDNGLVRYFNTPLSGTQFRDEISLLHYSLYFRNDRQGIAVASGSFFDTVKFLKPYISLDNRFVCSYSTQFPDTGHIAASVDEMASIIKTIIRDKSREKYQKSVDRLRVMRDALSLENIAISFKEQL